MRTNIEIDDGLMSAAMAATGAKTKRETVDIALKRVAMLKRQEGLLQLFGSFDWQGDLDAMRRD